MEVKCLAHRKGSIQDSCHECAPTAMELAAFTHFPLGDGSRESFLEGIALVWALKDKFLFLKSYLSHQLEGTWLISVWQILYNELTSSLEFFPKLVSLSLSSGADHRLVHCPFWVSIFSSVTQILAAILGSWTFPVDQRWSWKMLQVFSILQEACWISYR